MFVSRVIGDAQQPGESCVARRVASRVACAPIVHPLACCSPPVMTIATLANCRLQAFTSTYVRPAPIGLGVAGLDPISAFPRLYWQTQQVAPPNGTQARLARLARAVCRARARAR